MDKIRIGILGCSGIAKKSMISNFISSGNFEVVVHASRTLIKAKEFSNEFGGEYLEGYQNLIDRDDIDCVYISLPTGMHYEWVMKSLEANKHVFVEKSITTSFEKTQHLIKEAKIRKLCVFENFMFIGPLTT